MTDVTGAAPAAQPAPVIRDAVLVTEFDPHRVERLRRYTWWMIVPIAPVYAGVLAVLLFGSAVRQVYTPFELVVLSLFVIGLTVEGTRFSLAMMAGLGRGHRVSEQLLAFLAALATFVFAAWSDPTSATAWVLIPAMLAGTIVPTAPPQWRWALAAVLVGVSAAVTGGSVALFGGGPMTVPAVLVSTVVTAFTIFAISAQAWLWDIVLELDRARETSAELAVAKERLRFAADLHDIQGHHLQVIALKGELAERLTGVDDEAARTHAAEIAELARTALRETRDVVHGYRRSDLVTELDNAREILEAAGIETTVEGTASAVAPPLQPLFGALVREGATNILRHSTARRCLLTISVEEERTTVLLRNDGARDDRAGTGSGLDGLRQRFSSMDGHVRATCQDGWFELMGYAVEQGGNRS